MTWVLIYSRVPGAPAFVLRVQTPAPATRKKKKRTRALLETSWCPPGRRMSRPRALLILTLPFENELSGLSQTANGSWVDGGDAVGHDERHAADWRQGGLTVLGNRPRRERYPSQPLYGRSASRSAQSRPLVPCRLLIT